MPIALFLIAAFLLLAGSAVADDDEEVIRYWGDHVVDLTVGPDGVTPIGLQTIQSLPLSGGQFLHVWLDGSKYGADPDVTTDLISGNWYFAVTAIQQPSGDMEVWGTGTSYLDYFGGLSCGDEGGGGWKGTFHGVLSADGDARIKGKNEGCGELEGWRMKHHEEWQGDERTFWGKFIGPEDDDDD